MDEIKQVKEAKAFAQRWHGRGYEKGDKDTFWNELLSKVFGVEYVSQFAKFEEHTKGGGFIDGMIPETRVIIEQKALSVSLDKPEPRQGTLVTPLEQAIRYAHSFSGEDPARPHWIVLCNFETFRVYDRDTHADAELAQHYLEFTLQDFGENPSLLNFLVDKKNSRSELEKKVSYDAGKLIGKLRSELEKRYLDPKSDGTQHALNVLCVRLVFCLFCEDTPGVFPKDTFLNYLKSFYAANVRMGLKKLFKALDTPLHERDPYDESVKKFPYVNGGLFTEETEIPNFDEHLHSTLLEVSQQTDWSKISPTIFGGIFEGTLNPETRRRGGMHYTSPENIHKVIDPLFLDAFYQRFDAIMTNTALTEKKRNNALSLLHKDLCSTTFFDPACGSGNFLTETFLCLRRLEDNILRVINAGQTAMNFSSTIAADRVSLKQFYGIEINDFAVRVARVALWIAQIQSNVETEMTLEVEADNFPLQDAATIVEGNALRLNWENVLPACECDYIIGNPPFIGYSNHSKEQSEDRALLFGNVKTVDYVACWYKKAAEYIKGHSEEGIRGNVPGASHASSECPQNVVNSHQNQNEGCDPRDHNEGHEPQGQNDGAFPHVILHRV